jgi:hypothetical protein
MEKSRHIISPCPQDRMVGKLAFGAPSVEAEAEAVKGFHISTAVSSNATFLAIGLHKRMEQD